MPIFNKLRPQANALSAALFSRRPSMARFLLWTTGFFLFTGSLLVGLYLTFPAKTLQARLVTEIQRQAPVTLSIAETALLPLATLSSRRIDVHFNQAPGQPLYIDSLHLAPWWSSLLRGTPGLAGGAELLGGGMSFEAQQSGAIHVRAEAMKIDLPLEGAMPLRINALLDSGEFHGGWPLQKTTGSRLESQWERVAVQGLGLLQDGEGLNLGGVQLIISGRGRSFKLERFSTTGGDIEATGSGTLLLANNPRDSRIVLDLSLAVNERTPRSIVDLLSLLGPRQADGRYILKLSGTLGSPVLRPQHGAPTEEDDS